MIGEIDEIVLQTGGSKPNCPPLGNCPLEDSAALPPDNRSVAADIDANLGIRLRAFPRDNALAVTPKVCG
jgi:hypothetical protein